MAALDIQQELQTINTGHKFLVLGNNEHIKHADNEMYLKNKLAKTDNTLDEKFGVLWGTLIKAE